MHRERQRSVLADEQLDIGNDDGREAGELGLDAVAAGRETAEAILAALVAHRRARATGVDQRGSNRRAGQRRFRAVDDVA